MGPGEQDFFKTPQVISKGGPADYRSPQHPGHPRLFSVNSGVLFSLLQALDSEVALALSTAPYGGLEA